MGKSPGKWIKTVLFGKKTSKSYFDKGKENSINEKEVHIRVRASETGMDVTPPEVSTGGVHTEEQNLRSEYREASQGQQDGELPVCGNLDADLKQTVELDMLADDEIMEQEKAATKAQAAFKGYLARRAFKALKGIIRLQALIRGHLVRRQAVSTMYCIIGIVKLQALVRGSRIRSSVTGREVQNVCIMKPLDGEMSINGDGVYASTTSLSANAFINKLLAPSSLGMPLRIQYDVADSNSVENWLERWSISCPWKPLSPPKRVTNSKVPRKPGNSHALEVETSRTKRSVRKVPSLFDNVSTQSTSELEKPRRSVKKVPIHPTDSIQDNPQNELEKVKRNLRKVHNPNEISASQDVNPIEKTKEEVSIIVKEEIVTIFKPMEEEITEEIIETNECLELLSGDKPKFKPKSIESDEKDENTPVPNGELKSKEDEIQKSGRRASFPIKQEQVEDGLQNNSKLPSYMQATQSAKAKLRGQGSPRFGQDGAGAEQNNHTRRHSLPSSTNGKISSVSPRTQKPLQGSGKGGNKSEKSFSSSRDGSGKVVQAQWRRW